VADALTGDSKSREEKRDGDVVTGSYTVADPDGRIRHVTYTAGKFLRAVYTNGKSRSDFCCLTDLVDCKKKQLYNFSSNTLIATF
jgi:hypothetical protein